jgi:hypothetical protein
MLSAKEPSGGRPGRNAAHGNTTDTRTEQRPKSEPSGILLQSNLDRAFRSNQRESALIYSAGKTQITQLSAKHTKNLGVDDDRRVRDDHRNRLGTHFDRYVVRPHYAGGPVRVLAAYRLPAPRDIAVQATMWTCALGCVGLKFLYARRFEYFGLALCIVMGLTGLLFVRTLFHALRPSNFELIVAGAITYRVGTVV